MDYRKTLNLPETFFPMKADLAQKESRILTQWDQMRLYDRLLAARSGKPPYILHDGPPYANGPIHIGTALNKILKDFVVKSKAMEGRAAPFVPGWDCHGLPIEHQVLKELGGQRHHMGKLEIRQRCREYAQRFVEIQRDEFKRLGCLGDWDHPYLTMTPDYEAAIVREFGKVVQAGGVYRAKKPVLWCPNDETALAEAEVEYEEHTSPSIYVKYPVKTAAGRAQHLMRPENQPTYIIIWTTTPWTLPASLAITLNSNEEYRRLKVRWEDQLEFWILAAKRIKPCIDEFGLTTADYEECDRWEGNELNLVICQHPWIERKIEIVLGEHVTMDQGTGCVHTAPGHGTEDYLLGRDYDLEVYAPVDDQGRFTQEVPEWAGMTVFEANPKIIELLKDRKRLVASGKITHTYPHCWRCKKPVIFRATEQWFISMGDDGVDATKSLRGRAVEAICEIHNNRGWIPSWGYDRILGMINSRPDWCISRQRTWGVPIVAFTCRGCKRVLYIDEPEKYAGIIRYVADQIEREGGSDLWFSKPADELLSKGTACPKCGGKRFEKENDILDVWFESGISHVAVLEGRDLVPHQDPRADLYLEGSDQHRGWFQSSLLTTLAADQNQEHAPYKAVLTHGFVVDGSGKKMSKSAGNVIAPQEVIQQHGAEVLRLWVAATDFREDIRISREILSHLVEAYRKIRNTCRFLLGNLNDFDPQKHWIPDDQLREIDHFLLHRLAKLIARVRKAYAEFEFHIVFHALNHFCAVDLSALYLDIIKDRLYTERSASPSRRAAQRVLHECLIALARLMAPVLSFTAEEIWQHVPPSARPTPFREAMSVHLCTFPIEKPQYLDESLAERWDRLLSVRREVARILERLRSQKLIGASLDAEAVLYAKEGLLEFLQKQEQGLPSLFIVSAVELSPWKGALPPEATVGENIKDLAILARRASGQKCARCWHYRKTVGRSPDHPTLCDRCVDAVLALGGSAGEDL